MGCVLSQALFLSSVFNAPVIVAARRSGPSSYIELLGVELLGFELLAVSKARIRTPSSLQCRPFLVQGDRTVRFRPVVDE
jgi:hypothetical protein